MTKNIVWVLEKNIFEQDEMLTSAIPVASGQHEIVFLDGMPHSINSFVKNKNGFVVFHRSLNVCSLIGDLGWKPGVFGHSYNDFDCRNWMPLFDKYLLNSDYHFDTVRNFVETMKDKDKKMFVRPTSSLKPLSGRTIDLKSMNMKSLDYGFYYDDPELPIVCSPIKRIAKEWRFVVVDKKVARGCEYVSVGRYGTEPVNEKHSAWTYAQNVVDNVNFVPDVYVLDVCESDGTFYVLEVNIFNGASLYRCLKPPIVNAIEACFMKKKDGTV